MSTKRLSAVIQIGGAIAASLAGATDKTKKEIDKVGGAIRKLESQQKKIRAAAYLEKQLADDSERAKMTAAQIGKLQNKLYGYQTQLKAAGIAVHKLADEEARLNRVIATQKLGASAAGFMAGGASRMASMRDSGASQFGSSVMMGLPLVGAAMRTMDFDKNLQLMANTAEMTDKRMLELRSTLLSMTKTTGQSKDSLLGGLSSLVAAGMEEDKAVGNLRTIGKAATATGSEVEDLSKTVFSLSDNLHVANNQMDYALDILAKSGKKGNFELKDMAREFPSLTAGVASLKMEGTEAVATIGAALQIARKGTGDASSAATNMANFLAKLRSPETLRKFQKNFGLDFNKVIEDAIKQGKNPIEVAMGTISRVTKGGNEKLLGSLFQDMQVQQFIRPMLQHWQEYQKIKAEALGGKGTVDEDFKRMEGTNAVRFQKVINGFDRLATVVGDALGPTIDKVIVKMDQFTNWLEDYNKKNPGVISGIVDMAAKLLILNGAIGALKFVVGGLLAPVFKVGGAIFNALGPERTGAILGGIRNFITGGLSKLIPLVGRGLMLAFNLARAALLLFFEVPVIGWTVAIIAAITLLILNWKKIVPVFNTVKDAIIKGATDLWNAVKPVIDGILNGLASIFGFGSGTLRLNPVIAGGSSGSAPASMPPIRGGMGNSGAGGTFTDNSQFNVTFAPQNPLDQYAMQKAMEKLYTKAQASKKNGALHDGRR